PDLWPLPSDLRTSPNPPTIPQSLLTLICKNSMYLATSRRPCAGGNCLSPQTAGTSPGARRIEDLHGSPEPAHARMVFADGDHVAVGHGLFAGSRVAGKAEARSL